ncbi:multiple epidermal growth factor-like domains protein 6 [Crassostrea angulata]|uniref:multiple epidermal growth factor-like domains protein 6 n=1 Tax=Magallana angulata TaxID=2784310 RepID=UPI0022B1D0B2|nr:multiple epidermal growth factor-like domains protein 6 [Crassostrea angulata]
MNQNLAFNKTVTVSQKYNNKDFDPSLAVDGDHSTDLLKCSLTASGQKEAWLTVDLGEEKNIAAIAFVHGGSSTLFANGNYECDGNEAVLRDCSHSSKQCFSGKRTSLTCKEGDTLAGISVCVSETPDWRTGTLCYQHDIEQPLNNTINLDCVTSGRYVTLFNSRNETYFPDLSAFAYINICEIHIIGCDIGYYGEKCTKCPDNCLNGNCHIQIGHCFDCKDGFKDDRCEKECNKECPCTRYGPNCNASCYKHCQHKLCNPINGSCLECIKSRSGDFCEIELPAEATFDTVSLFIAATTVLLILVVVFTLYTLKRKCMSSRQALARDYDASEVKPTDSKYDTLQEADRVGTDTAAEYMEITVITG